VNATQAPLSPILQALERPLLRSSKRIGGKNSKAAKTSDSFCAQGDLPADALTLSVKPLSPLASPLLPAAAQALYTMSQPARHGRRDKTLLDKRVRDTGELPADTLALHWAQGACDALQAEVATALGLQQIEALLHDLLVYGPGQFFKPHQDTEKHTGMVATLVLVWPSPHIGGDLVVRHGSEQAHFASQHLNADSIRWFAFYADCRHGLRCWPVNSSRLQRAVAAITFDRGTFVADLKRASRRRVRAHRAPSAPNPSACIGTLIG
jgi:hypothetical protein